MAWPSTTRLADGPARGGAGRAKLVRGLTTLEEGQHWVLEPKQLDDSGALWSPGLRAGVAAGSEYHLTEYFGPILGVMRAETLDEAIDIVNAVDYGLTSGLHSLDVDEMHTWLRRIEAGNLYVNRVITGAIVQRQPFGGWKRSAVGAGSEGRRPELPASVSARWEPDRRDASGRRRVGSPPCAPGSSPRRPATCWTSIRGRG